MPAFLDPNNRRAEGGTVNFTMRETSVPHSPDYGKGRERRGKQDASEPVEEVVVVPEGEGEPGVDGDDGTAKLDGDDNSNPGGEGGDGNDGQDDGEPKADEPAKDGKKKSQSTGEDRSEWTKKDWKAQAAKLKLSTSGNATTLRKRVEDHEQAKGGK